MNGFRWSWLTRLVRTDLVGLVFPPVCAVCGAPDVRLTGPRGVCASCLADIIWPGRWCPQCAMPLGEEQAGTNVELEDCPNCRARPHRFDRALALGVYEGTMRQLVLKMKKAAFESLTLALGDLVGQRAASVPRLDFVTPIPIHWLRSTLRGTNTTEVLVESISRMIAARDSTVRAERLLVVRRNTKKQGTLAPGERKKNVRGAFRVGSGYDLAGKHVLVVDDVLTTGATLDEASRVLKRAGATRVTVAVVARGTGGI